MTCRDMVEVQVQVILWPTVSRPVSRGIRPPFWIRGQFFSLHIYIIFRYLRLFSKSHLHIPSLRSFILRIRQGPRLFMTFRNKLASYGEGLLSRHPTPKARGPPLVVCPQLLIQYICSYPLLLEAVPPSATPGRAMLW
jgi:hypothetical protein